MSSSEVLNEEAKQLYQAWLGEQAYTARVGQLNMIHFIAETLTREKRRIGVVEAGTGTGKTVAYCIPAALEARRAGKKLVIVTSTVLLQQQLAQGELHQLANLFSPTLTFGIIKGRGRYACIDRLDIHANKASSASMDLFDDMRPSESDRRTAAKLLDLFESRSWNGDMDAVPVHLYNRQTAAFTTDSLGCRRQTCAYAKPCPYFRARAAITDLDVVVTNYSLLMASGQEGVDLLPAPEDCIYVFDEVHRLAEIVMSSFAAATSTAFVKLFLDRVEAFINRLITNVEIDHPLDGEHHSILNILPQIRPLVEDLKKHFDRMSRSHELERNNNGTVFRYPAGCVDGETRSKVLVLDGVIGGLNDVLRDLRKRLEDARSTLEMWIRADLVGRATRSLNDLLRQASDIRSLLKDWNVETVPVSARWLSPDQSQWRLHSVPIEVNQILEGTIWSRAYGVVCTSATIYASDGFGHFMHAVGLDLPTEQTNRIASPFDFRNKVRFQVPDLGFSRPGSDDFNAAAARTLPQLLGEDQSGLILFTSRQDMEAVFRQLPEPFRSSCIKQGDASMVETLASHRSSIDNGHQSYLFGLASYREGVDLPGDYCQHVVIMRIPFSVPDDPVTKTQKDLLDLNNAFMQFDVPDASMRLFQACGRLLRSESDHGTISVLDRRIVTAKYRKQLLLPLPPFKIVDRKLA